MQLLNIGYPESTDKATMLLAYMAYTEWFLLLGLLNYCWDPNSSLLDSDNAVSLNRLLFLYKCFRVLIVFKMS